MEKKGHELIKYSFDFHCSYRKHCEHRFFFFHSFSMFSFTIFKRFFFLSNLSHTSYTFRSIPKRKELHIVAKYIILKTAAGLRVCEWQAKGS